MASDENVLENDVMFLTETQLHPHTEVSCIKTKPHTEVSCIKTKLQRFNFNFNSSDFKFSSLAIGYKDSVQILDHEKHCGIFLLTICVKSLSDRLLSIALIHRTNTSSIYNYCYHLGQLVQTENIDFVMGDLNINYLDNEMRLIVDHALNDYELIVNYNELIVNDYELIVNYATHLNGSIIDHVYLKNTLKQQFKQVKCFVKSVYYSDHEFVKVLIRT